MATGDSARKAAGKATGTVAKAATSAKDVTARAAKTATKSTTKAVRAARATRAAQTGKVEEARQVAAEADLTDDGLAAKAIAEAEALHYQVDVNKRGLSVTALTKTLNERWENGWRLAHVLEQRGNTVLVYEKRE